MTEGHGSGAHGESSGNPGESSGPADGPPAPPQQGGPGYPPPGGYPPLPGYPPAGGYPSVPPPYPGYGPMQSAPQGYGSPPQLERPTTVRAGLGAFIAGVILGAIALVYELVHFADLVNNASAQAAAQGAAADPRLAHAVAVVTVAGGLLGLAIDVFFISFAWRGRNWARIVLWVFGALGVVAGLVGLGNASALAGFLDGLSICQWLLSLAGIVLLAQKSANEWYRFRKWQRATGQG